MNAPSNEEVKVSAESKKTPRWPLLAAGGALVLVPPVWLFIEQGNSAPAVTAPAPTVQVQPSVAAQPKPLPPEFERQLEQTRAQLDAKKPEESLASLERLVKEQPNSFAVQTNLCVAYGMLGRRDDAVRACQRAAALEPNNQLGKNNLAWVSGIKPPSAAP
jgi:Flp pilus assembly protein TadD